MVLRQIFTAGSSLVTLRVVNTMYPIIAYMVMIRVFPTDEFAKYIFSMSVIAVVRLFTFYGFESLGVDIISKSYKTKNHRTFTYLSCIICAQLIFNGIAVIVTYLIIINLSLGENFVITCLLIPFFEIFRGMWYFLGIQSIGHYVKYHLLSGFIYICLFFSFFNNLTEISYIPLFYIVSISTPSILCWIFAYKKGLVKFKAPKLKAIHFLVYRATTLFKGRILSVFNQESIPFILGAYAPADHLIIYDLLRKIVELAKIPNSVINQIIAPMISATKDKLLLRRTMWVRLVLSMLLYIIVISLIDSIFEFLASQKYENQKKFMIIYGLLIIVAPINYFYSFAILLPFNYATQIYKSTLLGSITMFVGLGIIVTSNSFDLIYFLILAFSVEVITALQRYIFIRRSIMI